MAITDICIVVGVALFALLGFRDGFFRKLFGILGLILGLILATKFMSGLGENIIRWLDFPKDVSYVLAFSFLYMFTMVCVNILFRWFGRSSRETLSMRSRFIGGALGLAQGAVVVSLMLLMFNIFDIPAKEDQETAVLYEPVTAIAPAVFDYTTSWMPASKDFLGEIKTQFEGKF
jgi:membrane protein required for colicin V production